MLTDSTAISGPAAIANRSLTCREAMIDESPIVALP